MDVCMEMVMAMDPADVGHLCHVTANFLDLADTLDICSKPCQAYNQTQLNFNKILQELDDKTQKILNNNKLSYEEAAAQMKEIGADFINKIEAENQRIKQEQQEAISQLGLKDKAVLQDPFNDLLEQQQQYANTSIIAKTAILQNMALAKKFPNNQKCIATSKDKINMAQVEIINADNDYL